MQRKRTEPPEIRRAQIIEAAKACFVEAGFGLTKVADIAERAGISVGLVYRYFPSKEALVEAIVAEDAHDQISRFAGAFEGEVDAPSAIRRLIAALRPMLMDRDRNVLMVEIAAEMARNDKVRAAVSRLQANASEHLRQRLSGLSGLKIEPGELEARLRLVSALVNGAAIQVSAQPELRDEAFLDRLERTAEEMLLGSWANSPTKYTRSG